MQMNSFLCELGVLGGWFLIGFASWAATNKALG
jgi:hypothetical protein